MKHDCTDSFVAPPETVPLSECAAIVSEIAERMLELEDAQHGQGADLVFRLAQLNNLSPDSFRATLELLSGNTSNIRKSFGDRERETGMRKQGLCWRWSKGIERIEAAFPELAAELRHQRAGIGKAVDPVTFRELVREAVEQGAH